MANALYDKGRQKFLEGGIAWLTDTIKVTATDRADYVPDLAAHEFFSDVPAGARISTGTLAGKTSTNGVADANDLILTAVTGDQFEDLIFWKDTGSDATSPLIGRIDTAVGLAFTPVGADILIAWDNGANKIFKL